MSAIHSTKLTAWKDWKSDMVLIEWLNCKYGFNGVWLISRVEFGDPNLFCSDCSLAAAAVVDRRSSSCLPPTPCHLLLPSFQSPNNRLLITSFFSLGGIGTCKHHPVLIRQRTHQNGWLYVLPKARGCPSPSTNARNRSTVRRGLSTAEEGSQDPIIRYPSLSL